MRYDACVINIYSFTCLPANVTHMRLQRGTAEENSFILNYTVQLKVVLRAFIHGIAPLLISSNNDLFPLLCVGFFVRI